MHEGDKKSGGFGWEKSPGLLSRDEGKWVLGQHQKPLAGVSTWAHSWWSQGSFRKAVTKHKTEKILHLTAAPRCVFAVTRSDTQGWIFWRCYSLTWDVPCTAVHLLEGPLKWSRRRAAVLGQLLSPCCVFLLFASSSLGMLLTPGLLFLTSIISREQ